MIILGFYYHFIYILLGAAFLPLDLEKPLSIEQAQIYHNQSVKVRGFLYRHASGYLVLTSQPNLKSCCINSPQANQKPGPSDKKDLTLY